MNSTEAMVYLSPLKKDDSMHLFNWINNKELVRYNSIYKPVHETAHEDWFKHISNNSNRVIFGIRVTESDKLIGSCQLFDIHPVFRTAELQVRIGDIENQSRGYGTIALNQLIDFGFRNLNLRRIFLQVFSDNIRAVKSYSKVGFKIEGTLRQAAFIEGEYKDIIIMGILKEEYYDCK